MKLWVLLALFLLWEEVQTGLGQQVKRRKEGGENRIRLGNKRGKVRLPKPTEKEAVGKSQSLLTQVLDKGRFLRLGAALTLPAGRGMELRCKGSRIEWNYPAYLRTYKDDRLSITQQDKYGQLALTSPSAADTGEYSCWAMLCDGGECEKETDRVSASYIYFADKDELFVPSSIHFEIIYLRPDQAATIPCRVTSPKVKVTLHREVPPAEVFVNGTQISYDPSKGFVIREPSPEHRGIFYCRAVLKDKPQISNKYQLLYVEVPSGPPSATIEASSSVAAGGDNFNITCTVLGEPEQHVNFTWTYPGQHMMRPVSIYEAWRLINRGIGHTTRISQSVLTVEDTETIDYGKYICRTKNKYGETAVTTTVDSF